MDLDAALAWRRRVAGGVVFTNGVFDVLHRGHVTLLVAARGEGAALVVALNADASVRRLKGPERPLNREADRAYVLGAFQACGRRGAVRRRHAARLIAPPSPTCWSKAATTHPGRSWAPTW